MRKRALNTLVYPLRSATGSLFTQKRQECLHREGKNTCNMHLHAHAHVHVYYTCIMYQCPYRSSVHTCTCMYMYIMHRYNVHVYTCIMYNVTQLSQWKLYLPSEVILIREISAGVPMNDPIPPAVTPTHHTHTHTHTQQEEEVLIVCYFISYIQITRK